jgi:hypothetical protein
MRADSDADVLTVGNDLVPLRETVAAPRATIAIALPAILTVLFLSLSGLSCRCPVRGEIPEAQHQKSRFGLAWERLSARA